MFSVVRFSCICSYLGKIQNYRVFSVRGIVLHFLRRLFRARLKDISCLYGAVLAWDEALFSSLAPLDWIGHKSIRHLSDPTLISNLMPLAYR